MNNTLMVGMVVLLVGVGAIFQKDINPSDEQRRTYQISILTASEVCYGGVVYLMLGAKFTRDGNVATRSP